jgi:hypothetical protein
VGSEPPRHFRLRLARPPITQLTALDDQRNAVATAIKNELSNAEFNGVHLPRWAFLQLFGCYGILFEAHSLANGGHGFDG